VYEGGGQRGSIVVPEGREGRGCRFFAAELGKAVAFFDHFHSSGSRGAVPRQPLGGAQATEVGGPFSSTTRNALSLGGFSVHSLGGGSRSGSLAARWWLGCMGWGYENKSGGSGGCLQVTPNLRWEIKVSFWHDL
jgi:hypothetical protein